MLRDSDAPSPVSFFVPFLKLAILEDSDNTTFREVPLNLGGTDNNG